MQMGEDRIILSDAGDMVTCEDQSETTTISQLTELPFSAKLSGETKNKRNTPNFESEKSQNRGCTTDQSRITEQAIETRTGG